MNPEQQRERFTAVSRAEKRLDDLELVVTSLAGEIVKDREAFAAAIGAERRSRLALVATERLDVDGEVRTLAQALRAFTSMTWWQRLRWFLRGTA